MTQSRRISWSQFKKIVNHECCNNEFNDSVKPSSCYTDVEMKFDQTLNVLL